MAPWSMVTSALHKAASIRAVPMKRLFLILILCLVFNSAPTPGAATGAQRPKLIAVGDHNYPPYEFLENGKPTGFNVELMRAVADVMGFDVEIRLGPWSKVRRDLEQGKADVVTGMYYSEERLKLVDFSVPHTIVSPGLFVRKDSPLRSFNDMRSKEIIVQKDDILYDYIRENGVTSHIIAVTDPIDAVLLLASGKHDCALLTSRFEGEYFKKKLNLTNIREVNADLPQLQYCFAVRKSNRDLKYRLDEGLNILKVNGTYRNIYEKWFGVYEKRALWKTLQYFVAALAFSALLFAASLLWSWSLKRQVTIRTTELRKNEEELRKAHAELEQRVQERTVELKSTNDRLKTSEAEKSLILNGTKDLVVYYDSAMNILWANKEAGASVDRVPEELKGRRCWDIWHQRREPCIGCPVVLARDTGQPRKAEIRSPDGRVWFIRGYPITSDNGELLGMAEFVLDITDQKQAEELLTQKRQQLETLNQTLEKRVREEVARNREKDSILIQQNRQAALGETLEHIAHQWKQPLSSISLLVQGLEETYSCGELTAGYLRQTVDTAHELVQHMAQTIDVFRDYYKPENKKTLFLVADAINKAISFVGPALRFHNITLEHDADPEVSAYGYPKEFMQVVITILTNARDAFRERRISEPKVVLRSCAEGNTAVLTITDNAGGIRHEHLGRIFDLYFTTRESSGGSGIGLYIAKNIIERRMAGELSARNIMQGVQFRIEIPRHG